MVTCFCPVSVFLAASPFLLFLNFNKLLFWGDTRLLLSYWHAGQAMPVSLGQPPAHLLTQFVWHYCPSLDATDLWRTPELGVQMCTFKYITLKSNGSTFIDIKLLIAPFFALWGTAVNAIWRRRQYRQRDGDSAGLSEWVSEWVSERASEWVSAQVNISISI